MWSKLFLFSGAIIVTGAAALATGCGDDGGGSTLPTSASSTSTSGSSTSTTSTSTSGAGGGGGAGGGASSSGVGGTEQGCMYCACSCAFQSVQVKDYELADHGVSTCEGLHDVSCDDDPPANFESCQEEHVYPCEW